MSGFSESKLPDFTLSCYASKYTQLRDFSGRWLVMYFYPKDNTSGCSRQARDFSLMYKDFVKHKISLVGVSRDSIVSHEKFATNLAIPYPLVSDIDGELCRYFDVLKEKSMYGRKYVGIERSTFIISPQQEVVAEFRKVKVPGHADEIFSTCLDYAGVAV